MFIRDVKTLIDFSDQIQDLVVLLSDPKKIKTLSKEYEKAVEIIAKRDEVLALMSDNKRSQELLAAKEKDLQKSLEDAKEAISKAEVIKEEALAIKASADRDANDAAEKLKNAIELEKKNAIINQKSEKKAIELSKKLSEVEAKNILLDESISRYNDAVSKLSLVKVG